MDILAFLFVLYIIVAAAILFKLVNQQVLGDSKITQNNYRVIIAMVSPTNVIIAKITRKHW